MKVLVACEFTGTVRDAFIRAGHDAVSCDLRPSESDFGPHITGDVMPLLKQDWDLMIGHPPCTYLTNSGVQHLYQGKGKAEKERLGYRVDMERWSNMEDGAAFFMALWNADIPRIALENPTMHRYAVERVGNQGPTQYVQPYEYGHAESKRTGLRLKNLPPLQGTDNVKAYMDTLPKKISHRVHYMSPGPAREKERSRFFTGIADAMADQWGNL